jgi:hypothetical protein
MTDATDDAWAIAAALIANDDSSREPFFTQQARHLVAALILWNREQSGTHLHRARFFSE